jgi:hypothetical protein
MDFVAIGCMIRDLAGVVVVVVVVSVVVVTTER